MKSKRFFPLMLILIGGVFLLFECVDRRTSADQVDQAQMIDTMHQKTEVHNRLSEVEIEDGWDLLFNGKDLTGWIIHGTEKWYVDQGDLVCESGPDKQYGYLSTKDEYRDFELILEFKQESNGNSGVFFHSSVEGVRISGWQVEVAPPGSDTGGIYESYGRGWLMKVPDDKEDILQMGEWNSLKIRVVGDNVTTWLNGQMMINFTDKKIGQVTGSIALQIHSGGGIKLRWRNLQIRRI